MEKNNWKYQCKKYLYQTAFWNKTNEFVKILGYDEPTNTFNIETISKEKFCVHEKDLTRFCL